MRESSEQVFSLEALEGFRYLRIFPESQKVSAFFSMKIPALPPMKKTKEWLLSSDFFTSLNLQGTRCAKLNQIHSRDVFWMDRKSYPAEGDGMLTSCPNLLLLIYTADCVPLFLFSPEERVIGLVHIGWRGLAAGIVSNTLSLLQNKNLRLDSFLFAMGPAIGGCCYEVDRQVLEMLRPDFPDLPKEKAKIDLRDLVKKALLARNISLQQIFISSLCTFCSKDFFSYRRNGTTSRMVGGICLFPKG